MVEVIKQKLHELEKQYNISILYACESGSRAWGFASTDSDFDVRFIYTRTIDNYLSINESKDVIDLPVNDVLDIGGWDIKKSLKLFLKSNAPLYEWLQSPVIYQNDSGFDEELRQLMPQYFSLRAGGNHYLSMALNTVNNDLTGDEVKIKRYFYALRSTLACKWIVEKGTVPPMEFGKLRVLVDDPIFQDDVDKLLEIKRLSDEKTLIKHSVIIDQWLDNTLSSCKIKLTELLPIHRSNEELNAIFKKYILS